MELARSASSSSSFSRLKPQGSLPPNHHPLFPLNVNKDAPISIHHPEPDLGSSCFFELYVFFPISSRPVRTSSSSPLARLPPPRFAVGSCSSVLEETLLPFLRAYNASLGEPQKEARVEWEILTSLEENDGVRLGAILRARWDAEEIKEVVRAVVLGGDGTSHG